jgi:uncharacterized protein (UPF0332 family)
MTPFARALVRKSERALKTARIALSSGDFDNAVNRSFYSMFDIARAALLEAGVAEDRLPRTHTGLIDAFRQHAVQTGKFDKDMAPQQHLVLFQSLCSPLLCDVIQSGSYPHPADRHTF